MNGSYRNQFYRQLPINSQLPHINSKELWWFLDDGSHFETLKELKQHIDKGGKKMIVNYEKAVEYLVEAYKNSLKDDGDFLAAELNDNIGGGNISVVTYNEETDQLEVDDDQYIPKQLT